MSIRAGTITAIYLFDVAEQIDLPRLSRTIGTGPAGRVSSKSTAPAYLIHAESEPVRPSSIH